MTDKSSKARKEDNSLNGHDDEKKLEKTNMSFGDSIKSKDENDSIFSLSHENVFNLP